VFEYAKRDLRSADNIGRKENGVLFSVSSLVYGDFVSKCCFVIF